MSLNDPLMTKADLANVMRCCERTLERRVAAKEFPPPVRFGKESLWFGSVIEAWLERQRAQQQQWLASTSADAGSTATDSHSSTPAPAPGPKPEADTAQERPRKSRAKPRPSQLTSQSFFSAPELEATQV